MNRLEQKSVIGFDYTPNQKALARRFVDQAAKTAPFLPAGLSFQADWINRTVPNRNDHYASTSQTGWPPWLIWTGRPPRSGTVNCGLIPIS